MAVRKESFRGGFSAVRLIRTAKIPLNVITLYNSMAQKYNPRLIKGRHSYTPGELAGLFGISRKTCFRWLEEGLRPIQRNTRPLLIWGEEVRRFLSEKKKRRKAKLEANEYLCMKCKRPVQANPESETIVPTGKRVGKEAREQLSRQGECRHCGTRVIRLL
jgi:DNA-directed RNA polymerase subunit RPC12/RpoP